MNTRSIFSALVGAGALSLAGCTESDLGTRCQLQGADGPIAEDKIDKELDYVSLGVPECGEMVCVDSAHSSRDHAYCSSECADDADCGDESGLVCRELLLDQEFLDEMRSRMSEEEFRKRFGDAKSRYCAEPKPAT